MDSLREFAKKHGFSLGEVDRTEKEDRVEFLSKTPDGKLFGIGYLKDDTP